MLLHGRSPAGLIFATDTLFYWEVSPLTGAANLGVLGVRRIDPHQAGLRLASVEISSGEGQLAGAVSVWLFADGVESETAEAGHGSIRTVSVNAT